MDDAAEAPMDDAAETIALWAGDPPTRIEGVPDEVPYEVQSGIAKGTTFLRNISTPTLTVFTPPPGKANGRGAVVVPGGGWTTNAWTHEGLDVARWLASRGFTAFLLKYRVQASDPDQAAFDAQMASVDEGLGAAIPKADKPHAIGELVVDESYLLARAAANDDGRQAIALARRHAPRFAVRPETIGMIGFSAGAFLTVDVALDPQAEPLAWIAAVYGGQTQGARVPDDAPPLFAVVAQDDILVNIVEGLHRDWSAAGRPSELHAFARGSHGFGIIQQGLPSDRWADLFLAWLDDLTATAGRYG